MLLPFRMQIGWPEQNTAFPGSLSCRAPLKGSGCPEGWLGAMNIHGRKGTNRSSLALTAMCNTTGSATIGPTATGARCKSITHHFLLKLSEIKHSHEDRPRPSFKRNFSLYVFLPQVLARFVVSGEELVGEYKALAKFSGGSTPAVSTCSEAVQICNMASPQYFD